MVLPESIPWEGEDRIDALVATIAKKRLEPSYEQGFRTGAALMHTHRFSWHLR